MGESFAISNLYHDTTLPLRVYDIYTPIYDYYNHYNDIHNHLHAPVMSSTMVMTMAAPPIASDDSPCCPGCGYALPLDHTQVQLLEAQARIVDLENQVRLLNEKASAAVDRWADYEDELTRLRAQLASSPTQKQLPATPTNARMSFLQSGTSRLSALLSPRKSHPDLGSIETNPSRPPNQQRSASSGSHHQLQPPPSPSAEDLLEALSREQNLRKEAETKVAATSQEVEELSAALFEQANEMVAEERRARAKLEQRVDELERRDMEKRRRLDKLEGAMNRIERVRLLLAEAEQDVESSKQTVKEIEDLERQQEEENRRIAQRRTAGSVPESVKENGDADSTHTHETQR